MMCRRRSGLIVGKLFAVPEEGGRKEKKEVYGIFVFCLPPSFPLGNKNGKLKSEEQGEREREEKGFLSFFFLFLSENDSGEILDGGYYFLSSAFIQCPPPPFMTEMMQ